MKLREIEEKNLCPKCGTRLVYESMPAKNKYIKLDDGYYYELLRRAWHCRKCDKYFEEVKDENA